MSFMIRFENVALKRILFPIAVFAAALTSMTIMVRRGLADYDSQFDLAMAQNSLTNRSWFLGFQGNPLVGLQSVDQATLRWLEPHSILLVLLGQPWGIAAGAILTFVLVGYSTYFLTIRLDFGPTVSRWTALLVAANTVGGEFVGLSGIDLYRLTPSKGPMISAAYLLVGILAGTQNSKQRNVLSRKEVGLSISTFGLTVWLTVVHAHYLLIIVPFCLLVGLLIVIRNLSQTGLRAQVWLLILFGVYGFWLVLGALRFHLGIYLNTGLSELVRTAQIAGPLNRRTFVFDVLYPTHKSNFTSAVITVLLALYVVTSALTRDPRRRHHAALITLCSGFLALYYVMNHRAEAPFPVAPLYVAWVFLPILLAGTLSGLAEVWQFSIRRSQGHQKVLISAVSATLIFSAIGVKLLESPYRVFSAEMRYSVANSTSKDPEPWLGYLKEKIGMSSSYSEYRGRLAFLHSTTDEDPSLEYNRVPFPQLLSRGIPTIHDQGHFASPTFVWFVETMFRDGLPLSKVKNSYPFQSAPPNVLQQLGVSHIIVSEQRQVPSGFRLVEKVPRFRWSGDNYRIYETTEYNESGESLSTLSESPSLEAFLKRWKSSATADGEYFIAPETVAEFDFWSSLTFVQHSSLQMTQSFTAIRAKSQSQAVLIVPIEFSNCLDVENLGAGADPDLIRVNGILTGIHFVGSLDIRLRYKTGPLHNSSCRLRDLGDFRELVAVGSASQ